MSEKGCGEHQRRRFLLKALLLLPLAGLLAAVGVSEGRQNGEKKPQKAEKGLDVALLKAAPRIALYLSNKGYKSVGVLPFKVKKGTRQPSYDAAPLAANLPGRLENALVMTMSSDDESKALKIIRDAAGSASQQRVGSWTRSKAAFDKLFSTRYPLAWGKRTAQPDVFLTGIVRNVGNRSTTTVDILAFTRRSWSSSKRGVDMKPVESLLVKTDRPLLRDLGYSYALARGTLKRGTRVAMRDQQALDQVNRDEQQGQQKQQKGQQGHNPNNVAGFRFEIYYNNVKQTIRPLSGGQQQAKSPTFQVDPPPTGARVAMVLTRLDGEGKTLGVVLKVNGLSTYQRDDGDSLACKKWLYDADRAGKPDRFDGFYMDVEGKAMKPFKVLSAEESATKVNELGDRAGWIDIDVFGSGEEKQDEEQKQVSTKGLARGAGKPATLKALRKQLMTKNHVKVKPALVARRSASGLIVDDLEQDGVPIETGSLPNPVRLGGISIKYYDRTKQGNGQGNGQGNRQGNRQGNGQGNGQDN
jgi:hypothetical protein